jgi:hypothetical protein
MAAKRRARPPDREPIAVICWRDATSRDGPVTLREIDGLMELQTVGWLIQQNDEFVSVAQERCEDEDRYRDVMSIPRVNIVSMKLIRA